MASGRTGASSDDGSPWKGSHSIEQYQDQPCQMPRSPVNPGASDRKSAPHASQPRPQLDAFWTRARRWRMGYSPTPHLPQFARCTRVPGLVGQQDPHRPVVAMPDGDDLEQTVTDGDHVTTGQVVGADVHEQRCGQLPGAGRSRSWRAPMPFSCTTGGDGPATNVLMPAIYSCTDESPTDVDVCTTRPADEWLWYDLTAAECASLTGG